MKHQYKLLLLFFLCSNLNAQTFTTKNKTLYDYYGYYFRQQISIEVTGLSNIANANFGLETIILNIHHNRVSDLKITLENPSGVSIWLSNRNGKDSGKNYVGTHFNQNGKDGLINTATAPFTGFYKPDGPLEYLNNNQNPNGTWKLLIEDLKAGEQGFLDSVQLIFGTQPARQNITKTCALESIGLCECPNGKQLCKLLPDLVIVPYFTKTQIQEYAYNDNQYPHQLKLAAAIANIGYGPMEIKGSNEWICGKNKTDSGSICPNGMVSRMKVKQRIFTKNNDSLLFEDCDAGTMYFEDKPGHNHFHVDDWVAFRLIKKINKKRTVVAKGNKVSYCLFTNGIFYQNDSIGNINNKQYGEKMPNYGIGYYPTCDFNKQGISVGGYDFYGMLYEGQYLTLPKGIKNGTYILEIEIDPNHWYQESNKKNNVFSMQITLTKQEH